MIHRTHTSTRARPDEKMGTRRDRSLRKVRLWEHMGKYATWFPYTMEMSSGQRQVQKKSAAKKRRQRDKKLSGT